MIIIDYLCRNVLHPLLDYKHNSIRLSTFRNLLKSQWDDEEKLYARQWINTKKIIQYAYEHTRYYHELFDNHKIDVYNLTKEDFKRIPILTKDDIRKYKDQLISNEYTKEELVSAKTGGSTGKSLQIYFDKLWQQIRVADMLRADSWANWNLGDKCAAVWGNPPQPKSFKDYIWYKFIDRMIYLDTMNLNAETMSEFVTTWRKEHPKVIFGHAHSIFIFAKYLKENNVNDLRPKGIIATSMMLLPNERKIMEEVFSCNVTNRYGCEEVGLIASQCEKNNGMHINAEHLNIELLDINNNPVLAGNPGNVVVTDLFNHGMPLIRYRVEDVGILGQDKCSCGRNTPVLEKVIGRVADFLKNKNGSLVAGVSLVERTLTEFAGIEQMQIIQNSFDELILNLVICDDYDGHTESLIKNEFKSVFGDDVRIKINYVDEIPQEKSGKYRFSICNI